MEVKRKISARKIIQALLTMVLVVVCVIAVSSATKMQQQRSLKDVRIVIKNSEYGFVTEEDVKEVLQPEGMARRGQDKMSVLNIRQVEHVVSGNPWVADAQVYVDNSQKLHIWVTQRVPVVRIFEKSGNSYYLDRNNEALPLSHKYNFYTTVVTNVPELKGDSASEAVKKQIMTLVRYIRADKFWNTQVSQVVVRDDGKFEIVPVLGTQQVIIGDTNDLDAKFNNLLAFYRQILDKVGWDKYEVLDVSYKGQLVASPKLDWRLPVDKSIQRPAPAVRDTAAGIPAVEVINNAALAQVNVKDTTPARQQTGAPAEKKKQQPGKEQPVVQVKHEVKRQETPAKTNDETVTVLKEEKKEQPAPKYIYNGSGN